MKRPKVVPRLGLSFAQRLAADPALCKIIRKCPPGPVLRHGSLQGRGLELHLCYWGWRWIHAGPLLE